MALYCDISRKKLGAHIRIEGDLKEIATDTSILLNDMYSELYRVAPILGDAFKYMITEIVTDPASPTWQRREPHEGDVRIAVQKPNGFADNKNGGI